MKKNLFAFLLALFPLFVFADAIEIDGIYYNIIAKAKLAEVTSNPNKYTGSIVIPETVNYDNVTYNVTNIGSYAFGECTGLTSVTIPNSVTSIGEETFYGCLGLTSITIPNSVTYISDGTFHDCSGLTSINIPNSVTSIGEWAFCGCIGLTSITIPDGVTSIESSAFNGCSGLTSISIPDGVTSIGAYAFRNCSDLTSIIIPDGVTSIGQGAFSGCSGLTSITIPDGVTSIGGSTFYECSGLTSITIPNFVTSIGEHAFEKCSGLTSVTIPNSVTSIGVNAFWGCSSLNAIHISDLAAWCEISFSQSDSNPLTIAHHLYLNGEEIKKLVIPDVVTKISKYAFEDCSSITSATINGTNIEKYAFYGCSGLTSVTFGNNVTSIEERAFAACSSLTSVTIPNSVTSIGEASFVSCSGLTLVTLGSGIKSIFSGAFGDCEELADVYCFAESVPTTVSDAFENSYVDYATLHVLASSVSAYSASAPWSGFGTIDAITSEDITIGDLGIGTFCGSNPIDLSGTEDVKAYVVSSYEKATGQVTLTRTYYVPPFTGVVVKGNKGVYTIPAGVGEPVYPNMMNGVTTDTNLNKVNGDYTNYVLANKGGNLGFYAVADGSTLGAGKAYLPLPTDDLPSAAREFTLFFDDGETTEIMKVASQEKAPQGYYDLQGRRVANPTSGLYIVNGKKVIIK